MLQESLAHVTSNGNNISEKISTIYSRKIQNNKLIVAIKAKTEYSTLGRCYVRLLHSGSSCSLARAMDDRIMRCGIISSCQSAATSEIVKRS